jgi:phage major head subunit gpT-like protein
MLTPVWLADLESNMRVIQEDDYAALAATTWWSDVAKVVPSRSKRELIHWLLSTAYLEDGGPSGGNVQYDEIESTYAEVKNRFAVRGLEIAKSELEDLDGNGVDAARKWASDMGQAFACFPQQQVSELLINGQDSSYAKGYDGKALFATDHPINPVSDNGLTYKNYFTGADALPIDSSVTVEEALVNLSSLYGQMAAITQPNGKYPRRLRPFKILVSPALFPRAAMLSQATLIAMAAGSAAAQGGSGDVSDFVKAMNYGTPVQCDELGAAVGGSDTTYYVVFAPMGAPKSTLGPIVYTQREPFTIVYHGPQTSADLARKMSFQWTATGRNGIGPGHGYLIAKVNGS